MTWDAFHRRGQVLRSVLAHADAHRDGVLPMDLPGVAETFGDELALLGALQLRWHTRLAGAVERELMGGPDELGTAVLHAWLDTAAALAGVRAILDVCTEQPSSEEMAAVLARGHRKDWILMAAMAGQASPSDETAVRAGRALEQRARAAYRPAAPVVRAPGGRAPTHRRTSLLDRVRAHRVA